MTLIFCTYPMDLHCSLTAASVLYETSGLNVNTDKTEVLCQLPGGDTECFVTQFHIGNPALKIVRDSKYLGAYVSADFRVGKEVESRISRAAGEEEEYSTTKSYP